MEPPCEHGGVLPADILVEDSSNASMEPPCEHGGVSMWTGTMSPSLASFNGAAV